MGISGIQIGALLMTLAAMNRGALELPDSPVATGARHLTVLYLVAAAVFVTMHAVMTMEYNFTNQMHSARFYQISAIVFPVALIAAGRAAKIGFPATAIAAIYIVLMLLMIWTLELFPAEPKLA